MLTIGTWGAVSSIWEGSSIGGLFDDGLFEVKKETRIPIVKINAEKIDKKDKESFDKMTEKA